MNEKQIKNQGIYPILSDREFFKLPYAFKEMIKHDRRRPIIPDVIPFEDIPRLKEEFEDWHENKNNIRVGCQNVIKKQRGSGGSAGAG